MRRAFKGAAEPLTRREPSPEMRATLARIVDQMDDSIPEARFER